MELGKKLYRWTGVKMDIQTASIEELRDLQAQIISEITRRESAEKTQALKKVRELMQLHGLDVEDIQKKGGAVAKAGSVAAKYQNPADATQTWTGRGRKPLWVQAYLDNGGQLEALLIG